MYPFTSSVIPPKRVQAWQIYLFVTEGVPWTALQVSNNLFDMSTTNSPQGLGLADWRQLVAFVQDVLGSSSRSGTLCRTRL